MRVASEHDARNFPATSDGSYPYCQPGLPHFSFWRSLEVMEVHFTPEQEAKLAQAAAQQGRNPDELVQQDLARYFDEESRFIEAVNRGEEALRHGEYLEHEQVGQRLERFLRP